MNINFDKPVQTCSGKYVTIFTTHGPDKDWPIVGGVEGSKATFQWNLDGVVRNKKEQYNLVQAPDFEDYTTDVTEGENGRGDWVASVEVLPSEKKVKFHVNEGWTYEVLGGANKSVSSPKKPTQITSTGDSSVIATEDPPGGLAGAYFKQLQEENIHDQY